MISRKTVLGLLSGASVSAMVFAAVPAQAGQVFAGPQAAPFNIDVPTDFIVFDNTFTTTGDVNVNAPIGPSELPILIEPGANIDGALNINDSVTAVDIDTDPFVAIALSAGIVDLSGDAPTIVNNDEISALSKAISSGIGFDLAIAGAAGIVHFHEGGASDTNNGEIDVDAVAVSQTFLTGSSIAIAVAAGDLQIVGGPSEFTQTEDGEMTVDAQAISSANGNDNLSLAIAAALGVTQVSLADNASATSNIAGEMEVNADAEALYGGDDGTAIAIAVAGVNNQIAIGNTSATTTANNTGDLEANARADVIGGDDAGLDFGLAIALSDGIGQAAIANPDTGNATASITNDYTYDENGDPIEGTGEIAANSKAFGDGEEDIITIAGALGTGQLAWAGTASADLTNTGDITANADAETYVEDGFGAAAALSLGSGQLVIAENGDGSADITNNADSTISGSSEALVIGTNDNSEDRLDFVGAFAIAGGTAQAVDADGNATANITNDGTMTADADATAIGQHETETKGGPIYTPEGFALAIADAQAASQSVEAEGDGTITFSNSSDETLRATSSAEADGFDALAIAISGGDSQYAETDGNASEDVNNTGTMESSASAPTR